MRIFVALLLAGCGSSVVGAECAVGYTECGGACVDLSSDPRNCGACGMTCAACELGVCVEPIGDGGVGSLAVGSAIGDPFASIDVVGAIGTGCALGSRRCDGECVRPDSDPDHCGGCGIACGPGQVCDGATCADVCSGAICEGACVATERDPSHCGGCGIVCETGVCDAGVCASEVAGHAVLVGHDYAESRSAMDRVAGNAVFLGRGAPVRVLAYEGSASIETIAGTDRAIASVAELTGRSWTRTVADDDTVPVELASADVFVVYAQSSDDGALVEIGRKWSSALSTFLRTGGVVVVFEGAAGASHRILATAGVMGVAERTDVTRSVLSVLAPGDAIALGVPLSYRGERTTVRFSGAGGVPVIGDREGPVVVHYTVLP